LEQETVMREMVECEWGGGRRVTVNLAESPLGWLRARGLVDARQFDAGEALRRDHDAMGGAGRRR
jgi:hypothetical protein